MRLNVNIYLAGVLIKRYRQMDLLCRKLFFGQNVGIIKVGIIKVGIIKTKSATMAYFSSPPFLSPRSFFFQGHPTAVFGKISVRKTI